MVSKYYGNKEKEWQVEGLCRFHGFESSMPKRSVSYAEDRPVGGFHVQTPKDELLGCLLGVSSDCPSTRGPRKDSIHLLECQLSLYYDALWVKKCWGHVPMDDDEDVPR